MSLLSLQAEPFLHSSTGPWQIRFSSGLVLMVRGLVLEGWGNLHGFQDETACFELFRHRQPLLEFRDDPWQPAILIYFELF